MALPTGFSFKSRLAFAEIRARVEQLGQDRWTERESSWYGDYIAGTLWGVGLRIFDGMGCVNEAGTYDPRGYMLLDYARGSHPTPELDRRIRDELLPALDAVEWREDERND
jgi:hypothetical protein